MTISDKEMLMKRPMKRLSNWRRPIFWRSQRKNRPEPQVIVPQVVDLALPKTTVEEIAVPASINGRSLADGRP
jgi:hypothetical protein